ncbi:MAG: hypothetical protein KatS3mg068_2040 [Candidatus Sericytochromatia bacterium]|nr:MAG: hypothetical protein KatS3mg068_2040 [Candidatus Sericytochromatia bacterium]
MQQKEVLKTVKGAGAVDVASGGGSFYLANGMVERADAGVSSRSPLGALSASAGIGADRQGNVYAVSGNVIKKVRYKWTSYRCNNNRCKWWYRCSSR